MSRHKPVLVSSKTNGDSIKFVKALLDESTALLIHLGQTQQHAVKLSQEFITESCRMFGGKCLYFGKNMMIDAQQRRQQIRDEFNRGADKKDLVAKYQLSDRRIHDICHKTQDTVPAKATTKGAVFFAIPAARMFMKIGETQDDAARAARGLLATLFARFAGRQFCLPRGDNLARILRMIDVHRLCSAGHSYLAAERYSLTEDQITEILAAYPAITLPDITDLPKIKTRLFNYSKAFSDYTEVSEILHETAERISRAEEVIARLKG